VIKLPTYRAYGFIDFEILAYRRIQRFGVPFFACLEKCSRFEDSAALLFSTVGSSDLTNLHNFPLLLESFQSLHRINIIHGDVRMENMINVGGSIFLIDLAFSRDYSPFNFTSIFSKLLFKSSNRASRCNNLSKLFSSLLKDIIKDGFLKDASLDCDSTRLSSIKESLTLPFIEKFYSFWNARVTQSDVLEFKNSWPSLSNAAENTCENKVTIAADLSFKVDSAFMEIREGFLEYFRSISHAILSHTEHAEKYSHVRIYPKRTDEEYFEIEVLCAIRAAGALEDSQDSRFRGLRATASNRILRLLKDNIMEFKLFPEDDLESLVKTLCFLTYRCATSGIISGPPEDPFYLLEC
jgi:hypothetical protein